MGKQKEGGKEGSRREYRIEGTSPAPIPRLKPKPEIIHPLDLTGARVEVVPPHTPHRKSRRSSSSASSSSGEHRVSSMLNEFYNLTLTTATAFVFVSVSKWNDCRDHTTMGMPFNKPWILQLLRIKNLTSCTVFFKSPWQWTSRS